MEKYTTPEMELVELESEDIILASDEQWTTDFIPFE